MGRSVELEQVAREHRLQYSVLYYQWMRQSLGVEGDVLENVIESNNVNWAAEHVFKVNYREYRLFLRDGTLYSPDFGDKTLVQMADDAILIRAKAGADLARVEGEKAGVVALEQKLRKLKEGQVAVIISPLAPGDPNMGQYNMIYIYELQAGGQIRATAIRDEKSSLEDLQALAHYISGIDKWDKSTHLEFVASPIVTDMKFDDAVETVGISKRDVLPSWVESMSWTVAQAMLGAMNDGDLDAMKSIFDAFQMSVKVKHEMGKTNNRESTWIDPLVMQHDERLWFLVQRRFLELGGREMMESPGSCGIMDVGLRGESILDNNVMSTILGVNEASTSEPVDKMECVTCPFCHKTVDAILTSTKIKCPECKAEVSRS